MTSINVTPIARSVPFNNATNGFVSTEVQSAIEEAWSLANRDRFFILFGFDGTASTGRWLESIGNVPSDGSPVIIPATAIIKEISISCAANATTTIGIYKNGTTTLIASISISAARTTYTVNVNVSLAAGDSIGAKVTSGSSSKPVIGIYLHMQ